MPRNVKQPLSALKAERVLIGLSGGGSLRGRHACAAVYRVSLTEAYNAGVGGNRCSLPQTELRDISAARPVTWEKNHEDDVA